MSTNIQKTLTTEEILLKIEYHLYRIQIAVEGILDNVNPVEQNVPEYEVDD